MLPSPSPANSDSRMATTRTDTMDLCATPPPNFGHAMLKFFGFDPDYVNLNHGSFGALPHPVHAACNALSSKIESNPDYFIRLAYSSHINSVREQLARLIGAERDECVMVPSVTHGIHTILRNFQLNEGDVVITSNTMFETISRGVKYLSDTPPHPTVSVFTLSFPASHSSILSQFREHLRSVKQMTPHVSDLGSVPGKRESQKIIAILDSIVSTPGILMPWKDMVQVCKEEGVWSVIDAAHSIGQEVGIDLGKVKPDFWVSSCNKWLYTKRGCAVLYVPTRNQHIITSAIPTSFGYLPSSRDEVFSTFVAKFFWSGTIDVVPFLSVSAAIDFRNYLGGEEKINAYCHSLALVGGKHLARVMGTRMMDSDEKEGELIANMVNVELPLSGDIKPSAEIIQLFHFKLLVERKAYAAQFYHNGKWWVRASAQIYNEIEDFEKLGDALILVCKEIAESPGICNC